ncbi:MFS transporter [Nonomuraea sp. NPDC050783]|uniref:MFS transporter n=1 Tax=Nonomuraea sp. NPDC050783 TaxID=3154634 RepID=UPI003466DA0B
MLSRYMAGAVAARTANEMSGPALLIAGLAVTGSPVVASWLLAGLTVTAAVGGPLLGVLLDRARRPGLLLGWCVAGYAGGLLVIVSGLGRLPDAALVAVAVAAGVLGPAFTGGWTAQLPAVAGPARLERANALDAMTYNVAGLAGPALAGLIAAAGVGSRTGVLVCAALLAAALPVAWTLPPARTGDGPRPAGAGIGAELRAGFAVIVGNPALRRATAGSMVSCAGMAMVVVAAPVLGVRLTGASGHGALLLAVVAGGGLVANVLAARRERAPRWWDAALAWGTAAMCAGTALAAVSGTFWLAVAAAVLVGLGEGPQLTALFSVRHREAPDRLRAQVFTTGASLKITSFALGSAVAGPLAAHSVTVALLAGAAAQAVAVAVLALGSRRPSPAPAP